MSFSNQLVSSNDIASALVDSNTFNRMFAHYGAQALFDAAHQFGVLELLCHQYDRFGGSSTAQWKQHYLQSVALDQLRHQALLKLSTSLANANLYKPAIAFKGYALAYTVYPNSWLRPRADIDILCSEPDITKFDELLIDAGYGLAARIPGKLISKQQTYFIRLSADCLFAIDLHWRLSNRQRIAAMLTHEEIIQSATQIKDLGEGLFIPDKVHSLLIACLHRLGHHAEEDNLIWLYDIVLLVRSMTQRELNNCALIAQRRGCFSILRDCVMSSQDKFGALLNDQMQQRWQSYETKHEQAEFYTRKGLSEAQYILDDLKVLPLTDGIKLIREHIFPNAAFLKASMPNSPNIAHAYASRIVQGARKYLTARK